MENRRRRVPAMAPEERRAALIEATIPLLHEHGLEVSTRQIASAAGVAEGTIFGVFESKSQLVVCSVVKALDPQPDLDGLAAIDRSLPLRERVILAAELVHRQFLERAHLMHAARKLIMVGAQDPETVAQMAANRAKIAEAVTAVFAPDAAVLRVTPDRAAHLLLMFCGANTFGPYGEPDTFSGADLASLLLDGIHIDETEQAC
ncbi:TetR/AcrR family transcriptional regulator [Actinoplanes subglobosus]|uniref:TetR/AcrR family transcriptional regulator n=1 Tax=Actinoplanes subglobosus TaxID=1547892 RepID=A0ABV8ILN5_9ACTN